ncbi:hypothetical protein Q8A67_004347 [Cirrhinus molitorella]|uniref:Uncharacterized protein n=1 Tax=Cirrhinus molitorella TaxID=172907 RepID=A0AA88Q0B8_9TELE|nr:hypothetical protein Q8A67_004347 [Cirrhinus molitorella]
MFAADRMRDTLAIKAVLTSPAARAGFETREQAEGDLELFDYRAEEMAINGKSLTVTRMDIYSILTFHNNGGTRAGMDYNQTPEASEHQGPLKPLMAQKKVEQKSAQRKLTSKALQFTMRKYLKRPPLCQKAKWDDQPGCQRESPNQALDLRLPAGISPPRTILSQKYGFPEHHPPLKYVCRGLDGDPKAHSSNWKLQQILIGETLCPHKRRIHHGEDCQKRYTCL